jgi:hypothetical protein
MEIESALVAHPRVAEAAVVGRPHEIKGEAVFAYVVTRGQRPTGETGSLTKELRDWVGQQLGPIAKPDDIRFADNLPKTRSGKIMRRLLKAIARGEEITQDVSTLENPAILEQLRGTDGATPVRAAAKAAVAGAAAVAVVRGAARRAATRGTAVRRRPAAKARKSAAARPAAKRAAPRAAVVRGRKKISRRLSARTAAKSSAGKTKARRASAASRARRRAGGRRSR